MQIIVEVVVGNGAVFFLDEPRIQVDKLCTAVASEVDAIFHLDFSPFAIDGFLYVICSSKSKLRGG